MLGIHQKEGSYSDRWIQLCRDTGVAHKIVDCYASELISQLQDVDGLLWHWTLSDPVGRERAKTILAALENSGFRTFPSWATCWHYNDKIAQKYLLESIQAPLAPTYVFYTKAEALNWINRAQFPKVFKLRSGAGSQNVKLVRTKEEAERLCDTAFRRGFRATNGYFGDIKTKFKRTVKGSQLMAKLRRMPAALQRNMFLRKSVPREKGYLYFQDYLPNNSHDIRITVIGNRAFGFIRQTRPNDFRASGSGLIEYDIDKIDLRCVEIAFRVTKQIGAQSLAFDFVLDSGGKPCILEISYCFMSEPVFRCSGHWDADLNWHEGHLWPEDAIIIDFLNADTADKEKNIEKLLLT